MVTISELANRLLGKKVNDLEPEEVRALNSIISREPISQDAADAADTKESYGDHLADKVATIGGSWGFIIVFSVILASWMILNSDVLPQFKAAFDPYPYIFLNLMLSTVAAVQAPVIMMSQNRKDNRDRLSASLDYEVNLRAELEIMQLHRKLDENIIARLEKIEELLLASISSGSNSPGTVKD